MNILFIRHAEAVVREDWDDEDMLRPLTKKGRTDARKVFRFLAKRKLHFDLVLTSKAVRARQTAKLFSRAVRAKLIESNVLNPGCDSKRILRLLHEHARAESLALVGHEPDFSEIIGALCSQSGARIKLEKGACALVTTSSNGIGELQWLVPPFSIIGK